MLATDVDLAAVAAWAAELDAVHARIAPHFARAEPRRRAHAYLTGLLAPLERKNGWQMAEAAGDATPHGVQHLLGRAAWDADAVRDDLRAYVVEHLGHADVVLVVDETGFLKKGTHSAGVWRQYSGTAGRIENCQIGVFLAYAAPAGRAFLDRELYLPAVWTEDLVRRADAGVPEAVAFQTKPQLAQVMLERALAAGVPAAWVTGDEVYGGDRRLRLWLEERGQPFVLAVKRSEPLWAATARGPAQVPAATLVAGVPPEAWECLSAGVGAKGPRLYDWTRVPIRPLHAPDTAHWLLVRRSRSDPTEVAFFICFGPADAALTDLVRVAGTRWAIEAVIEAAKGEVGLDHYEVRRWPGWYRHVTLALLAHAFLAVTRAQATTPAPPLPPPSRGSLAGFRRQRGLGWS
jgi:SRSO17 transposase